MGHPEALLFVHHQQPQVFESDILGKQAVGADQDIHLPRGQLIEGLLLLPPGAETRDHFHRHREVGHPLLEGEIMLLGQDGGGHQHRHLLAVIHRLEGRPHRHFGLAVAHVAADQAVHRPQRFHVFLHIGYRLGLVRGVFKGK